MNCKICDCEVASGMLYCGIHRCMHSECCEPSTSIFGYCVQHADLHIDEMKDVHTPRSNCEVEGCENMVARDFIALGPQHRPPHLVPGLKDSKTSKFCQQHSCWYRNPTFKYALACFQLSTQDERCELHVNVDCSHRGVTLTPSSRTKRT